MTDQKVIQTIIPADCPHCGQSILINYQLVPPTNLKLMKIEDVNEAKEELKKKLDEVTFTNPEEKNGIIAWLGEETTLITKDDVEAILQKIVEGQK